jgi:hypothetical protein
MHLQTVPMAVEANERRELVAFDGFDVDLQAVFGVDCVYGGSGSSRTSREPSSWKEETASALIALRWLKVTAATTNSSNSAIDEDQQQRQIFRVAIYFPWPPFCPAAVWMKELFNAWLMFRRFPLRIWFPTTTGPVVWHVKQL